MKRSILKMMIVAGLIALSADLRAFTAVTSGAWSNAATWGGVGPGATVTAQDIIIPSGISVDMDMHVSFNGLANSFWVTGSLNSSANYNLVIAAGTLTGTGTLDIRKLTMNAGSIFAFTGGMDFASLRNEGTIINLTSDAIIRDTLDLDQGSVVMGVGSSLTLDANSNVRVNSGVLVNNGGVLIAGGPYDVWYIGITKLASQELNTGWVRDITVQLSSNAEDLILSDHVLVNGTMWLVSGHVALGGYRLTLHGDLIMNGGTMFESNGSSDLVMSGPGGSLTGPLTFQAGSTLDELIVARDTNTVTLHSPLTITNDLDLAEGKLVIASTGSITMGAGSNIHRSAGKLINNGTFDGTQSYSVSYNGDSLHTGVELSGSGLNSLNMTLWNEGYILTVEQDLVIPGNFILQRGHFDMRGYDLTVTGDWDQDSIAPISADLNSTINMSMSQSVNDTLWMYLPYYPLDELIIDVPQGSVVTLGANVFTTELTFVSGKLDVGSAVLKIGTANPIINGANDTNYIVTQGQGWVWINLNQNDPYTVFPIGTMNNYSPVALKQVAPGTSGYMKVQVRDGVWTNGTNGVDVSLSQSVVNKTWYVVADSGVVYNMDIMTGWGLSSEVNGFDRTQSHIKNFYNTAWSGYAASAALTGQYNTFTSERLAMQNDGLFAVVDGASPLSIEEPVVTQINVYPNPATENLFIEVPNAAGDNMKYELYDATGRLLTSTMSTNERNAIDMSAYDSGSYTLRITNTSTNEVTVKQVVKS